MLLEVQEIRGETISTEVDGAILDLDGTAARGYEDGLREIEREVLPQFGLLCPSPRELRGFSGGDLRTFIRRHQAPDMAEAVFQEAWSGAIAEFQRRVRAWVASEDFQMETHPDVPDLVERLGDGFPIAIATNASRYDLDARQHRIKGFEALGIPTERIVTSTCVGGVHKPDPTMLREAARRLGVSSPFMGGDSLPDAHAGSSAGFVTVIVARGRSWDELCVFTEIPNVYVVQSFADVRVVG